MRTSWRSVTSVVEKTRHAIDRLIDGHADDIQLAQQALARLEVDIDPDIFPAEDFAGSADNP